ncbi:MAG: prolipoprotein diacylglyceryl transferase [Bacteroidota bacterium]|nr:prolipoprotein diacylglyceryl transferase [Bacteroidota bacterium]
MFPRISDLINYIFGTTINIPIQSYGFMMAVAFVIGGYTIYLELKRKEKEGILPVRQKKVLTGAPASFQEIFYSAIFGFILGWKGIGLIADYSNFSNNPQEWILSGKGSLLVGFLGAAVFGFYSYYTKQKKQKKEPEWVEVTVHPYQLTLSILLIAAVFGIIGSKLFDVAEHLTDLAQDPIGTLFSFAGLSFYGGLIVATFAVVWYASKHNIRFPHIADVAAPGLILAYGIGRIGCQLSGDGCWGVINNNPKPGWMSFLPDWLWSFNYPHNVIDEGIAIPGCTGPHCSILPNPVFPTPLYETLICLGIFVILWLIRKHLKTPGFLFSIYLIMNATERFLIETIRVNKEYNILGIHLTQAQCIAIFLAILGISGFFFFTWLDKKYRVKSAT